MFDIEQMLQLCAKKVNKSEAVFFKKIYSYESQQMLWCTKQICIILYIVGVLSVNECCDVVLNETVSDWNWTIFLIKMTPIIWTTRKQKTEQTKTLLFHIPTIKVWGKYKKFR